MLLILAFLPAGTAVAAASAQLRAEEGPHYVGVPVRLQVIAEGFDETPQPEIEVDHPPRGRLELIGVSPNVSTNIQIINGRMNQFKRVQFVFEYRFLAQEPGEQVLGPFRVSQNGRQVSTGRQRLSCGEIPVSTRQRVQLVLPEGPLTVGQHVPIRLEWWSPIELRGKLFDPLFSVPFFDRLDAFRFHDPADQTTFVALTIDTASGPIELPASTRLELSNGKQYQVRTITRQLTPLKPGEFHLPPSSLIVDEAVRWRRTLFGERIPTHAQKRRVVDKSRTLVVRDPPAAGRPESFTGTVGRGYRLEVAADRSVVQVGDPIRLTLTLEGDAAVETAVLPPLTADSGLSPHDFRVPEGKPAGVYSDGAKRFEVTVRALHEAVSEIPPLAFSWYDPEQQAYQTTRSQPVALSVRPAQVVSAEDVVSRTYSEEKPTPGKQTADTERTSTDTAKAAGVGTPARPVFNLTGANLAITTDVGTLLQPTGSVLTSIGAQAGAYGLGLLAMIIAMLARRRAMADPAELTRIRDLRAQRTAVEKAQFITEVSGTLRRMVATAGMHPPAELDSFLAECDAYAYAPGGGSRPLDAPQHARALELADRILKENAR